MPCGIGLHPYFHCTAETRIDAGVERSWSIDEDRLPAESVPARGHYDLRDRRLCGTDLDNGFAGWSGEATIRDPSWPFAVRLSATNAPFLHLWTPVDENFFGAEPVSHADAALSEPEERWPELGIRVLETGEVMSLAMSIELLAP